MEAEPAGEQAIAVGDVDLVGRAAAGGAERARDQQRPGLDVTPRIANDRRFSGGAARGVQAHNVLNRDREHAEGVILLQVVLVVNGKASMSDSRLKSSGCTPAASNFSR